MADTSQHAVHSVTPQSTINTTKKHPIFLFNRIVLKRQSSSFSSSSRLLNPKINKFNNTPNSNNTNTKNVVSPIFTYLQKRYFIPEPELPPSATNTNTNTNSADTSKNTDANTTTTTTTNPLKPQTHILYSPASFKNISKWDVWEWTFTFASCIQLAGFLSTDVLQLRVLSLLSAISFMVAHANRRFFVGWFWALSFAISNIMAIYFLWKHRYHNTLKGRIDSEAMKVYKKYFVQYDITPYEFGQLLRVCHRTNDPNNENSKIEPKTSLTVAGMPTEKLYLLLDGTLGIFNKDGKFIGYATRKLEEDDDSSDEEDSDSGGSIVVDDPCFIGEFTLLNLSITNEGATATVKTETECSLMWWYLKDIVRLMDREIIDERKFLNMFTKSMSRKIVETNEITSNVLPKYCLKSMIQILSIDQNNHKSSGGSNNGGDNRDGIKFHDDTKRALIEYCQTHDIEMSLLEMYCADFDLDLELDFKKK